MKKIDLSTDLVSTVLLSVQKLCFPSSQFHLRSGRHIWKLFSAAACCEQMGHVRTFPGQMLLLLKHPVKFGALKTALVGFTYWGKEL